MAIFTKTFSANAPSERKPNVGRPVKETVKAPVTSPDNKRSFDARPKPSDDNRREERARPGQHIDNPTPLPGTGLDETND